jgi:hypothetical protein
MYWFSNVANGDKVNFNEFIFMSKKEMDALLMMAFLMFVFLVEQELACEIVYAPHYLKFEHSIIWAN